MMFLIGLLRSATRCSGNGLVLALAFSTVALLGCSKSKVRCGTGTIRVSDICVGIEDGGPPPTEITCGAGTVLDGEECVAVPVDAGPPVVVDSGPGVTCAEGATLVGEECVPDLWVGPNTLQNMFHRAADGFCRTLMDCGCIQGDSNSSGTPAPVDLYRCQNRMLGEGASIRAEINYRASLTPAQISASQMDIDAYVESYTEIACLPTPSSAPVFMQAFLDESVTGTAAEDDPCLDDFICTSAHVCRPNGSFENECGPANSMGQNCNDDNDCAGGLYCGGGSCASKLVNSTSCSENRECQGGSCYGSFCRNAGLATDPCDTDDHDDCQTGLQCISGTCSASLVANGEACDTDAQCMSGFCVGQCVPSLSACQIIGAMPPTP